MYVQILWSLIHHKVPRLLKQYMNKKRNIVSALNSPFLFCYLRSWISIVDTMTHEITLEMGPLYVSIGGYLH